MVRSEKGYSSTTFFFWCSFSKKLKKHRNTSKSSLQSCAGGLSGKNAFNSLHSQRSIDKNDRDSNAMLRSHLPRMEENFVHNSGSITNSMSESKEEEGTGHLNPNVVKHDNQSQKSPTDDSRGGFEVVEKLPQNNKPEVVHKIKWGDLEDESFPMPQENLSGAGIKFGTIGDDNMLNCRKTDSVLDAALPDSFHANDNVPVAKIVDSDMASSQIPSLASKDEISGASGIEVKDTSLEKIPLLNEKEVNQADDILNSKSENDAGIKVVTNNHIENDVGISEAPQTNCHSVSAVTNLSTSHVLDCGPEIVGDSVTSVEDVRVTQNGNVGGILSSSHNMSALEEDDSNESKERFRQRLWCFLFENLNRSVDELYLLCELECDLEQMKEAILVLEEAASDFKELINRVEEFEKVKKSSQIIDGVPVILKSDHRRTHAVSWEVRRMTSSPHKADILSSSLEAFRKIQQERASLQAVNSAENVKSKCPTPEFVGNHTDPVTKPRKQVGLLDANQVYLNEGKHNIQSGKPCKAILEQKRQSSQPKSSLSEVNLSNSHPRENLAAVVTTKSKREHVESEAEKLKKDKVPMVGITDKISRSVDDIRRQMPIPEKDKEKRNVAPGKSMNAWKEKRNWEDILSSPFRVSSRMSYPPGLSRKSAERARILHDKLMSPDKKKKTTSDLRKEAEEKHARAMRIRSELENERVQKLQRTSEKLNRVNEWQAVRNMKLREGLYARHQRSESRHEAYLAQVVKRAGDESSKVNEVRFITSLNEENKKLILRQKLHGSELRRAEKLQVIKSKQKEDLAREEAVLERRKLIEAEKLQRLAEIQRKKEEAQVRREEERKASSAAREARAIEQLRRKEERAKAQQEEAELLAQKLAERLSESEQRRKVYLEQIRERASMDFRDQSSPLLRRSGQSRSTTNSGDDPQTNITSNTGGSSLGIGNIALQQSMKRRIKKIRQRLMALKHEFLEPSLGGESAGIGYRVAVNAAKAKVGRWLQELQRLRQARKEGATSIGLIIAEMIKYLEGKDPELQASRQVGLLDFIASALPASHTSKPEACQVTLHLSKLLRVVLSVPANRSYFLAQNFLPPIIPMLSAALENYIKIAASINIPGNPSLPANKVSVENFELISEILNNFLWTVSTIFGHISSEERQLQMRDGLLELLISYQVIHRLRDLFALHDRPQMEGSSFPTPILLSIHLLVALTSRYGTVSSIDWNSFPMVKVQKIENEGAQVADSIHSVASNSWGDYRSPLSVINGSSVMHLPDVPEDRPLDELCKVNVSDGSPTTDEVPGLRQIDGSLQLKNVDGEFTGVPNESKNNQRGDIINSCVSQKDEKSMIVGAAHKNEKVSILDQRVAYLLSALSETGLVSLLSLLTAVLLQANNRSPSEQASFILPSNFEEVAAGVLKVLNNVALLNLVFLQQMLARPDLKMEIFHLMSFLLSHCTSKWKASNDQIGILMLESLSLLGHFALFHPGNQAVLRWGKSPTILHKICDLPFVFFSDPELMPVLAATLIAACYGCGQNKFVVQQELNVDMLISLLRSCKNASSTSQFNSTSDSSPADESNVQNQGGSEFRKPHADVPIKYSRTNGKGTRSSSGKNGALGNGIKTSKMRSQRDSKAIKNNEEVAPKQNLYLPEASSLMLYCRFPNSFIDKAEQFFSAEIPSGIDEVRVQTL
ncbi:uncharacterized protein LOC129320182 isoform X2 [Prosopis cineraria]|uniref:uncharacterized protein LOC129320182 isoform X2 n=1 Tax=Prosopis cineraria TaxID=364024 RepID=UPI0024101496|nr:uncharacterized protein LOC129320182 isoform X2 [Prosopis cineraria]